MNIIMNIIDMQYAIIHDITEFLLKIKTLNIKNIYLLLFLVVLNYTTYFCNEQESFLPFISQFFLSINFWGFYLYF